MKFIPRKLGACKSYPTISPTARFVTSREAVLRSGSSIRKDRHGFSRLYFLGSRCAEGLHVAGWTSVRAGRREVGAEHPEAYRCGPARAGVSCVARRFSRSKRSRVQDFSSALREGDEWGGTSS